MDLNGVVFPCPKFDFKMVDNFLEELIFIPTKNPMEHIPCLFLRDKSTFLSNNFLILFHGNAEDIFGARKMGDTLRQSLCINVIIVEYPGYSIYEGDPNTDKILENTIIVYDFIKKFFKINDKNIFVLGRSIGTSPAIYLASKKKPNALFTVSAFTSIRAVADNLVGALKVFLKDRLNSIDYIRNVRCPILLIHGQRDPLIPFKETLLLKEKCNCPFEVLLPEEMTHNDFDLFMDITEPISKFIKRNCISDQTQNKFKESADELNKLSDIPSEIESFIVKNIK